MCVLYQVASEHGLTGIIITHLRCVYVHGHIQQTPAKKETDKKKPKTT